MPANPRELLDKRRRETRDLETLRYVRPRGQDLHVVVDSQGVERIIGSIAGGTFSPGNLVLIGSESGGRAKEIIGLPQSGARRGGAFPVIQYGLDYSVPTILSAHPAIVPAGSIDFRVVLVVRSLSVNPLDLFWASMFDEELGEEVPDPLVTIHDVESVEAVDEGLTINEGTEGCVAVLVDLDASLTEGYEISIQPERA